jgi:signal transduction histidine kinase
MRVASKYFFRAFLIGGIAFGLSTALLTSLSPWKGLALLLCLCGLAYYWLSAINHWRHVHLVTPRVDGTSLANRQVRQLELPMSAAEAFALVESCLKEMPHLSNVESTRTGWQIRALARRANLTRRDSGLGEFLHMLDVNMSHLNAIVTPREGAASVKLICEPAGGVLADWLMFDHGSNFITVEALARNIGEHIGAARQGEREATRTAATQKEVAEAKLSVLEAQVEPHFLYNTLGSAKYLIRSDPVRAEAMLDNLIVYLRNSLPKTDSTSATLGDELQRARAYLDIMSIRMGERLKVSIDVPALLEVEAFPAMILQTLVENAIKHGLEPKPAGGTVWVRARRDVVTNGAELQLTVADDGLGMNAAHSGTGIGHRNIRERLRLMYGEQARFTTTANFPSGLAASIFIPITSPSPSPSASASTKGPV